MNIYEADLLLSVKQEGVTNQRQLARALKCSLGLINRSLKNLIHEGYLTEQTKLTEKAFREFELHRPQRAVILAAGFGMRMVPVNNTPKAMLEIKGERLIDRLIRQLHEAGIRNIMVIAGFMKEQFEYLIDSEGVELIYNDSYATRNNIHSLALASETLENCYILPCDIWCEDNPFRKDELYSWYMAGEDSAVKSEVRVNRKRELVRTESGEEGNRMIGITYLTGKKGKQLEESISILDKKVDYYNAFWEEALFGGDRMIIPARIVAEKAVIEINTYEQLRELDSGSDNLKADSIDAICKALDVSKSEIRDITVLKKGMTNRSFRFSVGGKRYIMRIPGEGTDLLINRNQEAAVYEAIRNRQLCDDPVWFDPESGFKITRYLEAVRVCNERNEDDLCRCMRKLRELHQMNLQVGHHFDLFERIEFYESLWGGKPSLYRDYARTKENVYRLKEYIDEQDKACCLTHIDAVRDNFLFYRDPGCMEEELQLTDWEYAGMQDPHVDLAMFSIYSFFDRDEIDHLIDLYFEKRCPKSVRTKIYCYVAVCGLLWSNWCEYKQQLGVEFGEYSLRQYRYAKEYFRFAAERIQERNTAT